jgi:DNA-binding NarL/FixJ family response regulator
MKVETRSFLVIEDDRRLRELLGSVLRPPGWTAILTATAAEALAALAPGRPRPAAVVLDLGLPDMDGVSLIRRVRATDADLPIIVLTVRTNAEDVLGAFRAGAQGYLLKEDLSRGIGAALEEALHGGAPISRDVARHLLAEVRRGDVGDLGDVRAARDESPPALTDRELQVLGKFADGLSYGEVAGCLNLSVNTVRSYVRAIYEKLSVDSKTSAVLAAVRLGLIAPRQG